MTRPSPTVSDDIDPGTEGGPVSDADIAVAADAVRRFLGARGIERALAQDLAQEAVVRLIEVRHRLDGAAAAPYAVTIAKNLVVAHARRADVERRHAHRMVDRTGPPSPEDSALREAEVTAVTAALGGLASEDRRALVAHVLEGQPTATLAEGSGGTAGGVAARLARTRAQMRVDYVLAARGVTLPTERCRPVLHAISAGDQRRQHRLRTARHLLDCSTCATVAPPLLHRQRSLVALVPVPWLAVALGHLRHAARPPQVAAAVAVAMVLAGVGVAVAAREPAGDEPTAATAPSTTLAPTSSSSVAAPPGPAPPPPAPVAATVEIDGQPAIDVLQAGRITDLVGRPVVVDRAPVESVTTDEGFWLGDEPGERIWVQLRVDGESDVDVTAADELSFTGVLVAHGPGFGAMVGLSEPVAGDLDRVGAHIEVDASEVRPG